MRFGVLGRGPHQWLSSVLGKPDHQAGHPFSLLIHVTEPLLPDQRPVRLDIPALWNAISDAPNALLIVPQTLHGAQFAVPEGCRIPRLAAVQPAPALADALHH